MEHTYQKIIAQNISKLRKDAGLSQFAFAIKACIEVKTLRTAEHADGNLELSTLEKIAEALGVPMAQLFEGVPGASSELNFLTDLLSGSVDEK